jgi:hypothetical protein
MRKGKMVKTIIQPSTETIEVLEKARKPEFTEEELKEIRERTG